MKKMSSICALSITTAVLCGLWSYLSSVLGLIGWAGFAGCTAYFACGEHGVIGLKKTLLTNLVGVMCGISIIALSSVVPILGELGIWCAIITFIMCIIAKFELFDFCPGTFIGCFSVFAAGGDWKILILSILIGLLLGVACDYSGTWLYKVVTMKNDREEYV